MFFKFDGAFRVFVDQGGSMAAITFTKNCLT